MKVNHWHYNDGWRHIPEILRKDHEPEMEFEECLVGWHCWAYASQDENIEQWMKDNMAGKYECDFRFNSGDPMHTIIIKENEDATLFKLKWM